MLAATLLALGSAGIHAGWNFFVKTSTDQDNALWGQFLVGGGLGAVALSVTGLPPVAALPWLVASALIHVGYVVALSSAYRGGDFSLVYPLARGGSALLAAAGGVLLLGDVLQPDAWGAIAMAVAGLGMLVGRGARRQEFEWAVVTAFTIAAYTLVDSHGSRLGTSGVAYAMTLFVFVAVSVSLLNVLRGRTGSLVRAWRRNAGAYLLAGVGVVAAYTMVLVAVRHAPVGYVAMLRESSIVIGALLGWLLLHERLGGRRLLASAVIVVGLAGLIVLQ